MKKIIRTWDLESESYQFDNDRLPDFLANCYHLKQNIGRVKDKKILEVGSGSGQISASLAKIGGKIHLLDTSTKSLEFSDKYFRAKGLYVDIYKQDAFNMDFLDESFDYVWNGGVIEHYSDDRKIKMLKEMWRLVKPSGKMIVTVPCAWDFPFMLAKKILEIRKKWSFGQEDDLTTPRIKSLMKLAGIKISTMYSYNPVVGYWFFPYGKEITNLLGLNNLWFHKFKTIFGHMIIFSATKPFT